MEDGRSYNEAAGTARHQPLTAVVDKVDVLECRECEPQGPQIHYDVTKLGRREGKVWGTHGGARGVGAS